MGARSQTGSAACQIGLVWRKVDAYHGYHVGAKFALFRPIFLLRQGNKPSARSLAPPLAQKGTLGSPTRLQTPSRRFAVAVGSSLSGNSSQASLFLPIDNAKDPARPGWPHPIPTRLALRWSGRDRILYAFRAVRKVREDQGNSKCVKGNHPRQNRLGWSARGTMSATDFVRTQPNEKTVVTILTNPVLYGMMHEVS